MIGGRAHVVGVVGVVRMKEILVLVARGGGGGQEGIRLVISFDR